MTQYPMIQLACRLPLANGHRPLTRQPPEVASAVPAGWHAQAQAPSWRGASKRDGGTFPASLLCWNILAILGHCDTIYSFFIVCTAHRQKDILSARDGPRV
jgi:hypothetical protein